MRNNQESYYENNYAEYWIENGIIIEVFKPQVQNVTLPMAQEIVEGRLKVSAQRTMPLYVDLNNFKSIDVNARKYFSEGDSLAYVSASAFYLRNYLQFGIAKIFLGLYKPKATINVFRVKYKAIEWLEKYKTEN